VRTTEELLERKSSGSGLDLISLLTMFKVVGGEGRYVDRPQDAVVSLKNSKEIRREMGRHRCVHRETVGCTVDCILYRRATRHVFTRVAKCIDVDDGIFENVLYTWSLGQ
jgi:hypothetical protein